MINNINFDADNVAKEFQRVNANNKYIGISVNGTQATIKVFSSKLMMRMKGYIKATPEQISHAGEAALQHAKISNSVNKSTVYSTVRNVMDFVQHRNIVKWQKKVERAGALTQLIQNLPQAKQKINSLLQLQRTNDHAKVLDLIAQGKDPLEKVEIGTGKMSLLNAAIKFKEWELVDQSLAKLPSENLSNETIVAAFNEAMNTGSQEQLLMLLVKHHPTLEVSFDPDLCMPIWHLITESEMIEGEKTKLEAIKELFQRADIVVKNSELGITLTAINPSNLRKPSEESAGSNATTIQSSNASDDTRSSSSATSQTLSSRSGRDSPSVMQMLGATEKPLRLSLDFILPSFYQAIRTGNSEQGKEFLKSADLRGEINAINKESGRTIWEEARASHHEEELIDLLVDEYPELEIDYPLSNGKNLGMPVWHLLLTDEPKDLEKLERLANDPNIDHLEFNGNNLPALTVAVFSSEPKPKSAEILVNAWDRRVAQDPSLKDDYKAGLIALIKELNAQERQDDPLVGLFNRLLEPLLVQFSGSLKDNPAQQIEQLQANGEYLQMPAWHLLLTDRSEDLKQLTEVINTPNIDILERNGHYLSAIEIAVINRKYQSAKLLVDAMKARVDSNLYRRTDFQKKLVDLIHLLAENDRAGDFALAQYFKELLENQPNIVDLIEENPKLQIDYPFENGQYLRMPIWHLLILSDRSSNLERLQHVVSLKNIGIFDRNSSGQSALHIATSSDNHKATGILLNAWRTRVKFDIMNKRYTENDYKSELLKIRAQMVATKRKHNLPLAKQINEMYNEI